MNKSFAHSFSATKRIICLLFIGGLVSHMAGCRQLLEESCGWSLEPSNVSAGKVGDENEITVCAVNRASNDKNCNLKADISFTKKSFGKTFKYNDLQIDESTAFPHKVSGIKKFCD